jgi:hypothetical protein
MSTSFAARALWCVISVVGAAAAVPAASADPPAPACSPGYVWRAAQPGDAVCVTPADRDTAAQENAAGPQNVQPNDGNVCKPGFVWRNAYSGDATCVTPPQRDQAAAQNAAAASHTEAQSAGCQKWHAPSSAMNFVQDDGRFVSVEMADQTLGPQANFSGGGKPTFNGTVANGSYLNGDQIHLIINWTNGWNTQGGLTIHPDGTSTGSVSSFPPSSEPDVPVPPGINWHGADKFLCDQ